MLPKERISCTLGTNSMVLELSVSSNHALVTLKADGVESRSEIVMEEVKEVE